MQHFQSPVEVNSDVADSARLNTREKGGKGRGGGINGIMGLREHEVRNNMDWRWWGRTQGKAAEACGHDKVHRAPDCHLLM